MSGVTAASLSVLQDRIKRDPIGYEDEFKLQHNYFVTQYEIFRLKPSKDHKEFTNLVKFLAAVAPCYPNSLREFPAQISDLLEQNGPILHPDLRKVLVKALILLRNRNLLSPTSLLSLFFKLFRCPDKALRVLLRNHIINDISRENSKKKSVELNRSLQNFMYTMLQEDDSSSLSAPRESLAVLIELFNRKVWNDAKTVNVISLAVFSKDSKLIFMTLRFFLSVKGKIKDEDDDEEKEKSVLTRKQIMLRYEKKMCKRTKSRKRVLEKKLKENDKKRNEKLRDEVDDVKRYNHAALIMINDPQGYAEKVFGALKRSNHSFDIKLGLMNLMSRLITANKLMIPSFYSFLQKYTQPHQQNITLLLAILAQSVHPLVTPEVVEPILMHITNNFVTDRRPSEVIAIGLNTIREICLRSPLVMTETLLKDLIQYKSNKDKGVMMASRSLVTVFRAINPVLLPRKERGKDTDLDVKPSGYGEQHIAQGIEGTEYLNLDLDKINPSDENSWETVSSDGEVEDDSNSEESQAPQLEVTQTDDSKHDESNDDDGNEIEDEYEENENENQDEDDKDEDNENENENQDEDDKDEDNDNENENVNQNQDDDKDEENENENENENEKKDEKSLESKVEEGKSKKGEESRDNTTVVSYQQEKPRLESIKILSDEEWVKIRYIQNHKKELQKKGIIPPSIKRKIEEVDEDVNVESIEGWKKKRRMSKEERIKTLKESKEEKEIEKKQFGYGRNKKGVSSTNMEKRKTKPYAMLRQKALTKQRASANQRLRQKEKHIRKMASQKLDHH